MSDNNKNNTLNVFEKYASFQNEIALNMIKNISMLDIRLSNLLKVSISEYYSEISQNKIFLDWLIDTNELFYLILLFIPLKNNIAYNNSFENMSYTFLHEILLSLCDMNYDYKSLDDNWYYIVDKIDNNKMPEWVNEWLLFKYDSLQKWINISWKQVSYESLIPISKNLNHLIKKTKDIKESFIESWLNVWDSITNTKKWIVDINEGFLNKSQLSIALAQRISILYWNNFWWEDYLPIELLKLYDSNIYINSYSFYIDNITYIYIAKLLYLFWDKTKQFNLIYNLKSYILDFVKEIDLKEKEYLIIAPNWIKFYNFQSNDLKLKFANYLSNRWLVESKYATHNLIVNYEWVRDRSFWSQYLSSAKNYDLIPLDVKDRFSDWYTNIDSIVNFFLFKKPSYAKNNLITKELKLKV